MSPLAVQLYAQSDYSLLESVLTVEALVKQAARLGLDALALTDHNTTAGHGEFERLCTQAEIKPIFGVELDVAYAPGQTPRQVVVLALTNDGYGNLLRLASQPSPIAREELVSYKGGLAFLEAGQGGELTRLVNVGKMQEAQSLHSWYVREFGSEFYLRYELGQNLELLRIFPEERFVLCQDLRHSGLGSLRTLEVLGKIKGGVPRLPNQPFLSWDELSGGFTGPQGVLTTTLSLAARCQVQLPREQILPPHPSGDSLEDLVWQGAKRRYGELSKPVEERLHHELAIINDLGYDDYFLIVADIVRFAKEAQIPVGPGRGSAASSLVAYVLGITEVDPLSWGLLFERFLNAERKKRPDIDLDFCYERRGEVLSYVARRFGRDHVAQIGTYGTFGPRGAAQEVKRVLGQDDDAVAKEIQGLKRHRSTHAAGVIITAKPTQQITAVYDDREIPVTHLDMYALENLGVLKIDLLGLRTLTLLQRMETQVQKGNSGFALTQVPPHDYKTLDLLGQGKSLGLFQLESDLFQELLRKLRPRSFGDLVALLALGRPGPLGMFPEYVTRRDNPEKIHYLHPELEGILGETYGLILYQEQVMAMANRLGGLSLGEADLLRSALGKSHPQTAEDWRERFVEGAMREARLKRDEADKIFQMIVEFSGYAFNKAHSVSYALLTWRTAYLKAHYPGEFFLTLLNEGRTRKEQSTYLAEAQGLGVKVLPPSVIRSAAQATLEGAHLRLGLSTNRQITPQNAHHILEGRRGSGWSSFAQFRRQVKIDEKTLETLVLCGAFDDLGARNGHLQELGKKGRTQLELLRTEKELLGVYASSHPCTPFWPLACNLRGEWDCAVGEILEIKATGNMRDGILDTPQGLLHVRGPLDSLRSEYSVPGRRLALFGRAEVTGVWQVSWVLPLGPILLITPDPKDLTPIKGILEDERGSRPTILLLGDAYHLLPQQFWVRDVAKVGEHMNMRQIVYTWFDPWKENVW